MNPAAPLDTPMDDDFELNFDEISEDLLALKEDETVQSGKPPKPPPAIYLTHVTNTPDLEHLMRIASPAQGSGPQEVRAGVGERAPCSKWPSPHHPRST